MKRAGFWKLSGLAILVSSAGLLWALLLNGQDQSPGSQSDPGTRPTLDIIERGAYLARAGNCQACHTQRGGLPYAGGRAIDTPFGTVFASNLTPDEATGLGAWTSADFWGALHHGRSRDGRLLTPAFPYPNYSRVTREDADVLFAYLRSLPAVRQENRPHELRFPYNTQAALAIWRGLYFRPAVYQADPQQSAEWNRGAYLSQGLGHCSACHSTRNSLGASKGVDDFSGGMLAGQGWYAPSLHATGEASVAAWDTKALIQWLQTGVNAQASALGPMAEVIQRSTQHLSQDDLAAMALYLQSLPQHSAKPSPRHSAELKLRDAGESLYAEHCASCHGTTGTGVAGAYPPLVGSRTVLMAEPANLLRIIQRGGFAPETRGNPRPFGMPPFSGLLNDEEQAAIASFVRNAWGNTPEGRADVRPVDVIRLKARRVD
ncbi:c-type cytochrome [Roseateles sp.]|uniref:c-type cytochrome n=1 Tax=Roseateles sp. TaxID=1971397 RepID=UPI003BA5C3EE